MQCLNCHMAEMVVPANEHPAYVECPGCGAIELTYQPLDYQEALHAAPIAYNDDGSTQPQILFVAGGYGSGKSRASLQEFFLRCLENPGATALIAAPTLPQLRKTSIKTLTDDIIPPMLIESFNKSEMTFTLINGTVIYAVAVNDEERLRSLNVGLVHLEEASAIDKSIYVQLLTRMRDSFTKVKTIFVCTNPSGNWVRDTFAMNEQRKDPKHPEHELYNPFIQSFIWPTSLNTKLPRNFIDLASSGRPDWWRRKFLEGSFEHDEGAVYPTAGDALVDPFEIPKSWERVIGADFGLRNPTAVPYLAIDPKEGIVYCYDEYYVAGKTVPEHAPAIKAKLDTIPMGRIRAMVGDPSGKNRNPINGKSVIGLYQEYDLFFQPGNNQIEAGILKVNSYFERGRLKIFRTCVNGVKELINYKFPELSIDTVKNLDERPIKYEDHFCDALRYAMMALPDDPDDLISEGHEPPKRYKPEHDDFDEDEYEDERRDWQSYA